ncbi:Zn(2)-C6 fungal-specific transcription factor [Phycomyces blakesleeanus NRRL 1555(-)]|uniref:Zn(2)-C6 fungal-specific transcription factor n=1 Tax=Phycomyces blakesleeanus (strain ATCC 8743b / DSM 1359 / FGSC 10004 / NBRC 33097 / NRRL 1555) TaxID=763407 RepID=A0A167PAD6_PHYB8|nr:Zn(2)-C6 fungal-specific transcription factor [Phycomyces blakesleeanus NRRL 1555(-)]OAD77566.1 Zn(2)-C6 fungal-specific transcription factor [Phycomyces blakesleeanus NRRL 1555(-)]|eukprot:XP_018295606.1 Zn(2)-C6 fungal-specific transcription factor [Phycomyces blakesleeanus NRRL 1555(-)]
MDEDVTYEQNGTGKKRVRATQACVLCRKKKIKCDGTKPECLHCQAANMNCEYTESKKRGPRKGYVQVLEERLLQMESRLMSENGEGSRDPTLSPITSGQSSSDIYEKDTRQTKYKLSYADQTIQLPSLDIVLHLVDLFFKYINSVFPLIHRGTLRQAIMNGTVSKPLLWSVLAIGARFSEHPNVKTDPPYLAGEKFAVKAASLINSDLFEPTLENLQFWGIMACLEYGRASGSRSWIYGSLAMRFCQELGLHKEDTLNEPILASDGSVDAVAMALRRRVFWSCLCIDNAGTNNPQCFERMDCDAKAPNAAECMILRDPCFYASVDNKPVTNDSLMDIANHHMRMQQIFGDVNKYMNRAKSESASIVWPPIAEFSILDRKLRAWKENLPDRFQYTPNTLKFHKKNASVNYISLWLSSHAVWCSSMMVLHRGSLAHADMKPNEVPEEIYAGIQASISACKTSVDQATGIFRAMKDLCGYNILPYMGYSAYVFATVLMTSAFSKGPEAYKKSGDALQILYELIEASLFFTPIHIYGLKPYWLMCERLANMTKDLLAAHSRLYKTESRQSFPYGIKAEDVVPMNYRGSVQNQSMNSQSHTPGINISLAPSDISLSSLLTSNGPVTSTTQAYYNKNNGYFSTPDSSSSGGSITISQQHQNQNQNQQNQQNQQQTQSFPVLSEPYQNSNPSWGGEVDFNSLEFLYDSALFGQIMFDASKPSTIPVSGSYGYMPPINSEFSTSESSPQSSTPTTFGDTQGQNTRTSLQPYLNSERPLWNSS